MSVHSEDSRSGLHSRWTVLLVGLCLVATLAGATQGYVVILKNGQRIPARQAYEIKGQQAWITLITGTVTAIPLKMVDVVATERYNKLGFGSALTVEGLYDASGTPRPTPTPPRPLGSIASIQSQGHSTLGSMFTPTPTATPGIKLQKTSYPDKRVDTAFKQIFDEQHLYLYRTSVGTTPKFFFVQVVTDSEEEVFHALKVVADAFALIHKLHPEMSPTAVELEMRTTAGKPAGTFRISLKDAQKLSAREISTEQFYVQHVIF